jgi:hypothetical protein
MRLDECVACMWEMKKLCINLVRKHSEKYALCQYRYGINTELIMLTVNYVCMLYIL